MSGGVHELNFQAANIHFVAIVGLDQVRRRQALEFSSRPSNLRRTSRSSACRRPGLCGRIPLGSDLPLEVSSNPAQRSNSAVVRCAQSGSATLTRRTVSLASISASSRRARSSRGLFAGP